MNLKTSVQRVPLTDEARQEFNILNGCSMVTTAEKSLAAKIKAACAAHSIPAAHERFEHEADPDPEFGAEYSVVVCKCDKPEIERIVKRIKKEFRRAQAWQNFQGKPDSAALWRCHFAKWIEARWFDSADGQLAPLVEKCKAGNDFDLDDPLTAIYWIEYLAEYSQRRKAWQKFEAKKGSCAVLSFDD